VIVAILAGAEIGGLIGIFLSIPVVGLVIVFYNHYLAFRGIQNLRVVVQPENGEGEVVPQPAAAKTTESLVEQ
jgi:predicted PurR-regulated permease PerM